MKKPRKALIPAAGLGTRFLPITQSIPKEMLPLVDRPILLYIIEEAIDAGLEDIIIIQGRNKEEIINFFDSNYELEDRLEKSGKMQELKILQKIRNKANIISIRQQEAKGLGHAVHMGKPVIGDEAFCVLLGDELMIGSPNPTKELVDHYDQHQKPVVSLMEVPEDQVHLYGIAEFQERLDDLTVRIDRMVEKPEPGEVKSNLALPGRYLFENDIFELIENTKPGRNGEVQLTDAMQALCKKTDLYGRSIQCTRHDTGNKLGYLKACVYVALEHPEVGDDFRAFLKNLEV